MCHQSFSLICDDAEVTQLPVLVVVTTRQFRIRNIPSARVLNLGNSQSAVDCRVN